MTAKIELDGEIQYRAINSNTFLFRDMATDSNFINYISYVFSSTEPLEYDVKIELTSSYIFGDNEPHTIHARYKYNEYEEITFDGKETTPLDYCTLITVER